MAKYKSFEAAAEALKKQVQGIADELVLRRLAEKARDVIYKRVKSGFGVAGQFQSKEKLKDLSTQYINYRASRFEHQIKRKGKRITNNAGSIPLGPFGTVRKSNLTLTGDLLENIEIKITRTGATLFFPDKKHKFHKNITIRQLAEYVEEQGRPFFYLTEDERQILVKDVRDTIRKLVGLI